MMACRTVMGFIIICHSFSPPHVEERLLFDLSHRLYQSLHLMGLLMPFIYSDIPWSFALYFTQRETIMVFLFF